jgi:hypothetical protein
MIESVEATTAIFHRPDNPTNLTKQKLRYQAEVQIRPEKV